MRLYVGSLVNADVQNIYNELTHELSIRFDLGDCIKETRVPHVIFKAPFERDSIEDIEELITGFASSRRRLRMPIKGSGFFDKDTLFMRVQPCVAAWDSINDFMLSLKKLPGISWEEYEASKKMMHITLARGEMGERFDPAREYLSNLNLSHENYFDNLTLFEKTPEETIVQGSYRLKN